MNAQSRLKPPARENPTGPKHFKCVSSIGTRDARMALWPAANEQAARQAGQMAAPTSVVQTLQKVLANGESSTDGLLRASIQLILALNGLKHALTRAASNRNAAPNYVGTVCIIIGIGSFELGRRKVRRLARLPLTEHTVNA